MNPAILLRKVQGKLVACIRGGGWLSGSASAGGIGLHSIAFSLCLMLVLPMLVLGLLALLTTGIHAPSFAMAPLGMALLGTTAERDLKTILNDIDEIEKKHAGKPMPQAEGEKLEALYTEGKSLQDAEDRRKRRESLGAFAKQIPDALIPDTKQQKESARAQVAGYMAVGEFLAVSKEYNDWSRQKNLPGRVNFALPNLLKIKGFGGFLKQGLVPLSHDQVKGVQAYMMESKDLPVIGSGVIAPDRLSDVVRATENDQLTIRDVINVSPTSSKLIEWLQRKTYTRGAEIQSEGTTAATQAVKGEADTEYELKNSPVRTIAVWLPVTEQQLQDAPAMVNLIDEDLLWDLGKEEEEEVVWGDGTGVHLDGLDANISAATNAGGYTSPIDIVRSMITEIRVSGYQPTFTLVHPAIWEQMELEKGSDGHYIWAIIRDVLGPRIWGTRVVESVAMEDPTSSGDTLIIVGDRRGCTLFDRMASQISMGWIDDYYVRNLRAIKAEERVAFAVRRPSAFRKYAISF